MEKQEIVNKMLQNGAIKVKELTIKNVTVTVKDEYTRLGISLDKSVDAFVKGENEEYTKGKSNIIFSSTFAVASLLKDDDEAAFAANHLITHPDAMGMILSRATITIVQQEVKSGEEYTNPFSEDAEPVTFDHDVIINHIVDIKLSDFGKRLLDKLADKMLGF